MRRYVAGFFAGAAGWSWAGLAVYLCLLAARLFPFSSSSERVAPYLRSFEPAFLLYGFLGALALGGLLARHRWDEDNGVPALFGWIAASLAFHATLSFNNVFSLSEIVQSASANSFYSAIKLSPAELLRRFSELPAMFPSAQHMHTNMVGKPLLYSVMSGVSGNPLFMGLACVVLGKLAAVPLYFLTVAVSEDRRKALLAAVFYLFMPLSFYFTPLMNAVTPLFLLGACLPVALYFRSGQARHAVLSGAMFFLLLLFEPAPGAVFCLFALLVAAYYGKLYGTHARLFRFVALSAAGFAACYVLLKLLFCYSLIDNMRQAYVYAEVPFYRREYWRWFALNPPLFLINCGIGTLCCAALAAARAPARLLRGGPYFMEAASVVALLGSLLFFNALGIAGAEASRLWLYLSPLAAMLAASYCVESASLPCALAVLCVSAVQAASTLPVAGFVVP